MGQDVPQEVEGIVVEILPNSMVRLKTSFGAEVLAHLSADARSELVRLLPGDRVRVALSSYNKGRGRILGRG